MEKMDQEQRQTIRNRISILSLVLLVMVVLVCFVAQNRNLISGNMAIGMLTGFLVFYWLLLDVAEPAFLHELKGMSPQKRMQYLKFAGLDLVGDGALVYFIYHIGNANDSAAIGAVIYVLCLNLARREREKFYNGPQE